MKTNRIIIFLLGLIMIPLCVNGQSLTTKRIKLLQSDLLAQKESRLDKNGNKCAVVRFDVVGVTDLEFEEAVGNVGYTDNEYIIYIPGETQTLTYSSSKYKGVINIEDFGPSIESGSTYRIVMESENNMRSAIFYVKPTNAKVIVDNKPVLLDDSGKGIINLLAGSYSFSITADGFVSENGTIQLPEDEIYITKDYVLEPKLFDLHFTCTQPTASIFVDDKPIGTLETLDGVLKLSAGSHSIRTTKEGFMDYEKTVMVSEKNGSIHIDNKELKSKIVVHKEERTRHSISLRKHTDLLFSAQSTLDDSFKSYGLKVSQEFHQYLGHLAFKEGINFGVLHCSDDFVKKIDKHFDEAIPDSIHKNAFQMEVPLQIGCAIPLSKYNTSQVVFLGGGYGQMYYIGHHSDHMQTGESVSSYTFDFGVRGNVTFYFHKFVLSFEISKSLSKKELGTCLGITAGYRFYNSN